MNQQQQESGTQDQIRQLFESKDILKIILGVGALWLAYKAGNVKSESIVHNHNHSSVNDIRVVPWAEVLVGLTIVIGLGYWQGYWSLDEWKWLAFFLF